MLASRSCKRIKGDLLTMGHVDMEPKLAGRQITMMLSPLPEHARQRRFKLSHGKLIEEDDFDEEEEDSAAEANEGDSTESVKEEAES